MLIQLKPSERSFDVFVLSDIKSFNVFILCEGRTEVEVIKSLCSRLGITSAKSVAISDCEGIDRVYGLVPSIALLSKLSRRLRALAVVTDADELSYEGRFRSLINSLRSRGINVVLSNDYVVSSQLFKALIKANDRELKFYVTVNGISEYEFSKHVLEDHVIKLLELEGEVNVSELSNVSNSKEFIRERSINVIKEVVDAEPRLLRESFSHLVKLMELVLKDP